MWDGASAVANVSMIGVDVAVGRRVMISRVRWVRQESLWTLNSSDFGFIRRGGGWMYVIDLSKISSFPSRAEMFPVCSTLTLPWQLGEYAYLF